MAMETLHGQKLAQTATTSLELLASLNIYSNPIHYRKTGIICTIGPVSRSVEKLTELIHAGMGVVRLNCSHGTHEVRGKEREGGKEHKRRRGAGRVGSATKAHSLPLPPCHLQYHKGTIDNARAAAKALDQPITIALDTKGPEIRTGLLATHESVGRRDLHPA